MSGRTLHPFLQSAVPFAEGDPAGARAAARARARALLAAAREAFPHQSPPPFDPRLCAAAIGVPVRVERLRPEWEAMLVRRGEDVRIVLAAHQRSPTRAAFSVAHELAHLFFAAGAEMQHVLRARDRESWYVTVAERDLERACDAGAAELLLPRPEFDAAFAVLGGGAAAIPAIAAEFAVSREAATLRVAEVTGGAAGLFRYSVRPSATGNPAAPDRRPAYRAARVFSADEFPLLFPTGRSVPETSAVYRASLVEGEVVAVEEHALGAVRARLAVSAVALPRPPGDDSPPAVLAVFRPV